jgi:hypothetical protein
VYIGEVCRRKCQRYCNALVPSLLALVRWQQLEIILSVSHRPKWLRQVRLAVSHHEKAKVVPLSRTSLSHDTQHNDIHQCHYRCWVSSIAYCYAECRGALSNADIFLNWMSNRCFFETLSLMLHQYQVSFKQFYQRTIPIFYLINETFKFVTFIFSKCIQNLTTKTLSYH